MIRRVGLALLVVILATTVYGEAIRRLAPLKLSVLPKQGMAPADIRVTMTIERNEENRAWCLSLDGPYSRTSCEQLDGENGRRMFQQYYEGLPEGKYSLSLALERVNGKTVSIHEDLCYRGIAEHCGDDF